MAQLEINPNGKTLRDASVGAQEFPTGTAGRGTPDGQTDEEVFFSCQQCGMWCLESRVGSPGGLNDGDGFITVSVTGGVGDPQVGRGGCPFCGSANPRKF